MAPVNWGNFGTNTQNAYDDYVGRGGQNISIMDKFNPDAGSGSNNGLFSTLNGTSRIGADGPTFWQSLFGGKDAKTGDLSSGFGGKALGAAGSIWSLFNTSKQLGLQKDIFNESKRQFGVNYENTKALTLQELRDRQKARVERSPTATPVAEYMAGINLA